MKVHTGFKIPKMTGANFQYFLEQFQKQALQEIGKHVKIILAKEICYNIDMYDSGEKLEKLKYIRNISFDFIKNYHKVYSSRVIDLDTMNCDIETNVYYQFVGDDIYGVIYSALSKINKLWFSMPEVQDYSYWNNSDRPKEIKTKEWNNRRDFWNKWVTVYSSAFSVIGPHLPFNLEINEVLEHQQSFESRLQTIVTQKMMDKRYKEIVDDTSVYYKVLDEIKANTPENKKLTNKYSKILKRTITFEDFKRYNLKKG